MNTNQPSDENELPEFDESRLAALLRAIEADAPAPDVAALAEIRQRTLDVFQQNSSAEKAKQLRSRMVAVALRGVAVFAATAAAIFFGFNAFIHNSVSGAPFSRLLDNLR